MQAPSDWLMSMELETVGDLPLPAAADREGEKGASGETVCGERGIRTRPTDEIDQLQEIEEEPQIDAAPDRRLKTAPSRTPLHVNDPFS